MRRYLACGAGLLVVLVNAWVLVGVARNRLGEPDATLILTEREMSVDRSMMPENSAVDLALQVNHWQPGRPASRTYEWTAWLQPPRLAELGFDVVLPKNLAEARRAADRQPARRAWALVQLGGDVLERWTDAVSAEVARLDRDAAAGKLREWEQQERQSMERELRHGTRLFLVDVAPDPEALRTKHPDRTTFLILPCEVHVELSLDKDPVACEPDHCRLLGRVSLLTAALQVPRHLQAQLPRAAPGARPEDVPAFEVVVRSGAKREPWIASIRPRLRGAPASTRTPSRSGQ